MTDDFKTIIEAQGVIDKRVCEAIKNISEEAEFDFKRSKIYCPFCIAKMDYDSAEVETIYSCPECDAEFEIYFSGYNPGIRERIS